MSFISREIESVFENYLFDNKAVILKGPRQTGKTSLLKQLFENSKASLWLDGEDPQTQELFENITLQRIKDLFSSYQLLIIDEAQKIPNIGSKIKLMVDHLTKVQVVVTGSSSLELMNKTAEALTGRNWEFKLFPISFLEAQNHFGRINEIKLLQRRMIFGYYPEIVIAKDRWEERLTTLMNNYLYKDIVALDEIYKIDELKKLVKALAFQIGSEVNVNELSKLIGLQHHTIEKYIQILEQCFILFRLPSYANNHRKELKKSKKIFFLDNGIRNAIICDYRPIELRQDVGPLFENYIISELYKKYTYEKKDFQFYFWRTFDHQEIDLVIEVEHSLQAIEIKYNPKTKVKFSKSFSNTYPQASMHIIHSKNYDEFL